MHTRELLSVDDSEAVKRGPFVWITVKWSTAAELIGAAPRHLLLRLVAVALHLAASSDARVHIGTLWGKASRLCTIKALISTRVCKSMPATLKRRKMEVKSFASYLETE